MYLWTFFSFISSKLFVRNINFCKFDFYLSSLFFISCLITLSFLFVFDVLLKSQSLSSTLLDIFYFLPVIFSHSFLFIICSLFLQWCDCFPSQHLSLTLPTTFISYSFFCHFTFLSILLFAGISFFYNSFSLEYALISFSSFPP